MNGFRIWRNSTARRRSFLRLICSAQLPLIRNCISKANTPGQDLMNKVRAGMTLQNTTVSAWCRQHGVNPSAARQAIYGTWAGPKGQALRAQLLKAAGVRDVA